VHATDRLKALHLGVGGDTTHEGVQGFG
jgi:hypothetical protein